MFSDLIWDKAITNVRFVDHFSKNHIFLFKCHDTFLESIIVHTSEDSVDFFTTEGLEWLGNNLFSDAVTIGGKVLPAGAYGLFTIPGENEWTIIFNTNSKGWGSFDYKEAEDVVRFKVAPETTGSTTETFTIGVDAITAQTATIYLKWGKTKVKIPISTDIKPIVRAQIEAATAAATVNPNVYQSAATFSLSFSSMSDEITLS